MEKMIVFLLVVVTRIKAKVVQSDISIDDLCPVLSSDQSSHTIYINCSNLNITSLDNISTEINTTTTTTTTMTTDNSTNTATNTETTITDKIDTTTTTTTTSSSQTVVGLDLSRNQLRSLDGGLLPSLLASLTWLDLSENQLSSPGLSEASLQPRGGERSSLLILNVSHNKISHLPPTLFASLDLLESLDLSFNPLTDLDGASSSAIGAVGSLQFLAVRGCGLRALQEEMMAGLRQLRTLDLSSNHFTRIDPSIRAAPALTSLIVDNNDIDVLDGASFEGLDQLHNLSVSFNRNLTTVEADSFSRLVALEDLRLSDNPALYWIHPAAWAKEDNQTDTEFSLKVFSLNNNSLTYLPSMLLPTFRDWSQIEVSPASELSDQAMPALCLVPGSTEQPLAV